MKRLPRSWGAATVAVGVLAAAGCGAGATPSPTPDVPDKGECIDLSGPDDDVTMTVVDCADAQYELLEIIHVLVSKAPCPARTHLELVRRTQFLPPGQTARPSGGFQTATYCLRDRSLPESSPTPTPSPTQGAEADVAVHDVRYTSETGLGDPLTVTLTLDNAGEGASQAITFEITGLAEHADVVECRPTCEVDVEAGGWVLEFAGGVAAGASEDYEVELASTRRGKVTWRLTIFAGPSNQVFTGTGTTEID